MTYSTLASIVKYPYPSTMAGKKNKFGFFKSEEPVYLNIAEELGISRHSDGRWCRHPLVYLVEAADDICYEIMDIEDAHKLGILTTDETKELLIRFVPSDKHSHMEDVMAQVADRNEKVAYLRSSAIGILENACVDVFVSNEDKILEGSFEGSLIKNLPEDIRNAYSTCSEVSYDRIYRNKNVVDIELAGYKIISQLIDLFVGAAMEPDKAYSKLLLSRVSSQYKVDAASPYDRLMAVVDFISGMTDVFALDLYRKINGESLPMI